MHHRAIAVALVCFFGLSCRSQAQLRALEPEQAGADFPLQGEYIGQSGGGKAVLAAQVAAQGEGAFLVALYPGGFPGDGYAGSGKIQASGSRVAGKLRITGAGWQGEGDGIELAGTGPSGAFTLRKVMRASPTAGLKAPTGAKVLFDGKDVSAWGTSAKVDARGFLGVACTTKAKYASFSLHLEFRLPFEPAGRGQDRANSGFCMPTGGWSELQILDSFGEDPQSDGCGSLYKVAKPLVTANLPPLSWQTYDIRYTAPANAGGDGSGQGTLTAWLNGVLVQNKTPLNNRPAASVIMLQDHFHQVFYRNIWMLEGKADYDFLGAVSLRPPAKAGGTARAAAVLMPGYRPGYLMGGRIWDAEGRAAPFSPR